MSEPRVETPTPGPPSRRPRDPWVRFACPHCGKRNKADALLAGSKAACARCGQLMTIPSTAPRVVAPSPPVMRAVDPPAVGEAPVEAPRSWLGQLSDHVAGREDATPSPAISPRKSFRLPTWMMVVLHASVTLGTIAALWLLHARGYLPGFDAAFK